ncbi:MAG: hypothetical protein AB7L84_05795 [Acidimicrobiia bacterium]
MTAVLLRILAVIWAVVLVPPAIQRLRERQPGDSIARFRNQLHVLERATPGFQRRAPGWSSPARAVASARPVGAPMALRRSEVRRRRRDIFLTLLAGVGLTFLGALAMGGVVWMLHLVVDGLFAGYVAMLVKLQQQTAERDVKVRYLPQRQAAAVDPRLLRRSATN